MALGKELRVVVVGDVTGLSKALNKASADAETFGGKMKRVGSGMASVGKSLTLGVTLPIAAIGVASFKLAEDFQSSMELLSTQANVPQKAIKGLSKSVLALAGDVATAPEVLATGLYHLASQGLRGAKAMDTLRIAAEGAKVGNANLEDVTNALGAVVVSGIKGVDNMSQAMGYLNATVGAGDMRMQDLADAMGTGLPAKAKVFGVSLKDVSAALAVFGDNNIRGAEAGTQLNSIMRLLGAGSKAADKELKTIGLTTLTLGQTMRGPTGLVGTIELLKKKMDEAGLSSAEQAQKLSRAFGGRQAGGILLLIGQLERLKKKEKEVGEGAQNFGEQWAKYQDTARYKTDQLKASLDTAGVALGSVLMPIVEKITGWLTKLALAFAALPPSTQKLIATIGAVAAVAGPLLIVMGSLVGAIGSLVTVFAAVGAGPLLLVAALVALGVAMAAAVLYPKQLQQALERMGLSAKDSKQIVEELQTVFRDLKAVMQTVGPVILAILVPALRVLQGLLMIVSGILRGDFSQAWKGVKIVVVNEMRFMLAAVTAMPKLVLAAAKEIGAAILHGIGEGLRALPGVVKAGLAALPGILSAAAGKAFGLAVHIGAQIVEGVLSGLGSLAGRLKDKVEGALSSVLSHINIPGFSPPKEAGAHAIGKPLAEGVTIGFIEGMKDFPNRSSIALKNSVIAVREVFLEASRVLGRGGALGVVEGFRTEQPSLTQQIKAGLVQAMKDAVKEMMDKARQAVLDAKGVFASAFDDLASTALAAFDRVSSQFQTKTEKKIAAEDARRAAADRQKALDDANKAIAEAQAALQTPLQQNKGESPEDFAARQAEATKQATEALISAQQQQADALFAIQRAADEKKAAQERKARDDSRELQRRHFEEQLTTLEAQLEKGRITAVQFRTRLLNLFEKFGVPFRAAGQALGSALAEGLHDSFADAGKAARALIEAIANEIAKAKFVVSVQVNVDSGKPGHRAFGGPVSKGSPYIVGEKGPELFVPGSSGKIVPSMAGGGGVAEITTNVYIDSTQVAELVRREFLRFQKRNGTSAV